VGNKITPCHPRQVTWHSKMTWPMTWQSKMTWPMMWQSKMTWSMTWHPSGPVRPRRAPRLPTLSGHLSGTSSGPVGHSVWPRRVPRLATPSSHPSGTPFGHPVGHPVRSPSGTPSGTPVLSRGSGRPSISEPLDLVGLQFLSRWIDARSGPRPSCCPSPI
jgi:hypothetical protein